LPFCKNTSSPFSTSRLAAQRVRCISSRQFSSPKNALAASLGQMLAPAFRCASKSRTALSNPASAVETFFFLHPAEQYRTSSQQFSHFFRQVITRPQLAQILVSPLISAQKTSTPPEKSNTNPNSRRMKRSMNEQLRDQVIRMAWEDRTTFDEIFEKTGLAEKDVIKLMRAELKPSSFRLWRKRVAGRITKHRKVFTKTMADSKRGPVAIPES
jgi:uncharacterized protein (TIGR03643 family)